MSNSRIAHGSGSGADIDVPNAPDVDAPSSARTNLDRPQSSASGGTASHPSPRVGETTPPPRTSSVTSGGSPTPLIGTAAPTGPVAGPRSPWQPGRPWGMAQPVGSGGSQIIYARTASPSGVQTSLYRANIDGGAASSGATHPSGHGEAFSSRNSTGGSGRTSTDPTDDAASSSGSGLGGVNERSGSGRSTGDSREAGGDGLPHTGDLRSSGRVGSGPPGSNASGLDAGPSLPGLAGPGNGGTHNGPHSLDPGATNDAARGRADTNGPGNNNAGNSGNAGNAGNPGLDPSGRPRVNTTGGRGDAGPGASPRDRTRANTTGSGRPGGDATGSHAGGNPGAGSPGSAHTNGPASADNGPPHLPGSHAGDVDANANHTGSHSNAGDGSPHATNPSNSTDPSGTGTNHGDAAPNNTTGTTSSHASADGGPAVVHSPNAPTRRDPARDLLPAPTTPLGKYKKVEPYSAGFSITSEGHYSETGQYLPLRELDTIRARRRGQGLPSDELSCRVELLDRRIHEAARVRRARDASSLERGDVLAVFTAPEWTFKLPGTPMTPKQRDFVLKHYAELSKSHPNMLIVPGSLVTNTGTTKKPSLEAESIAVYQGSIVKRTRKANCGGDELGYVKLDPKTGKPARMKPADFSGLEMTNAAGSPSLYKGDSSIFEIDGMQFALEICADHSPTRARRDADFALHSGVDVHILVSHGMTVQQAGKASHAGGVIITNDSTVRESGIPGGHRAFEYAGNYTQPTDLEYFEDTGRLQISAPLEIKRTPTTT